MSQSSPDQRLQSGARHRLQAHYDRLWSEAIGRIRAGEVEVDPVLRARTPDLRRGLTLIARPSAAVRRRVGMFLKELQKSEPDQYYYHDSEFHLTVLSLFTATADHVPFFARTAHYLSAADSALQKVAPIEVEFTGIAASRGTVMIQGFFENDALNNLRDALRQQLRLRGLAEGLDGRYRLESAHMTVARFRAPLCDSVRFARALEQARQRSFGATLIRSVSLVKSDWYMSRGVTETMKRYRLSITAPAASSTTD